MIHVFFKRQSSNSNSDGDNDDDDDGDYWGYSNVIDLVLNAWSLLTYKG